MGQFAKHHWGYLFLLPFVFILFGALESSGFQTNTDNYDISYSHITGEVIALEQSGYGTKVILNNSSSITLPTDTKLLIGRVYDFTYEHYTLKVDDWWNHFIGTRSARLIRYNLR